MRVWLDTSPLTTAHADRGIGAYTRNLLQALTQLPVTNELQVLTERPASPPDIIHYPFFDLFFSTLPRPTDVPIVVTIHDVIPLVFPKEYPPGIRGQLRFWRQRSNLSLVSGVITDSQASRQDIQKYLGVPSEKISVIPLAGNPQLEPVSEYLQRKYSEELGAPDDYIVYIGDINYNKNLPTLLLALTQMPETVHLCVVSRTFRNTAIPEGKLLDQMIRDNNLQERVHVLDIPSDQPEMLSAIIGRARCLVQPSLYEGFGLPVLEAYQVGTLVVCSNTSSLPEVAGEAAIMVEPTVGGLAHGIEEAWHLRGDARNERIVAGQKWAKHFRWSKVAEQTAVAYQSALAYFLRQQPEKPPAEKT